MKIRIGMFIFFFVVIFISEVSADTLYLRNGSEIEGLIKKEDGENVVLDLGFGTVKFSMREIERIHRSDPDEVAFIHKEWEKKRRLEEEKRVLRKRERQRELEQAMRRKQLEPKTLSFLQEAGQIVVETLLNKKVDVKLVLDTGASVVLLSRQTAERLKIKYRRKKTVNVQLADGRQIEAKFVILNSVNVEGVEAKRVEAVVILDDLPMDIHDGLLGMSFLKRFNFHIDTANRKLILERRDVRGMVRE